MERSRPQPRGSRRSQWQGGGERAGEGYKCGGHYSRTEEGLLLSELWEPAETRGPRRSCLPARKADVFARGRAKFAEQPSATWRSGPK